MALVKRVEIENPELLDEVRAQRRVDTPGAPTEAEATLLA